VAVCRERTASPGVARSWVSERMRVGAGSELRTPACSRPERCIFANDCMLRQLTRRPELQILARQISKGQDHMPASLSMVSLTELLQTAGNPL